jgi:hypothetical protein
MLGRREPRHDDDAEAGVLAEQARRRARPGRVRDLEPARLVAVAIDRRAPVGGDAQLASARLAHTDPRAVSTRQMSEETPPASGAPSSGSPASARPSSRSACANSGGTSTASLAARRGALAVTPAGLRRDRRARPASIVAIGHQA